MSFDQKAAAWDNESRVKRAEVIAREIAGVLPDGERLDAMEFGCGTGLISFNLCEKFRHVTLVDTSKGMIDTLTQKIQAAGVKNMTPVQADINAGETVPGGGFDVIYTSMVLHHIRDTETTLNSLKSLLKPGGYLCIVDLDEEDGRFHRHEKDFDGHNGFNQPGFKRRMEGLQFRNVTVRTFYRDCKVTDGERIDYSLFILVGQND